MVVAPPPTDAQVIAGTILGIAGMAINASMYKTYGTVILIVAICIVIFWVFMALRPASAQPAGFFGPGPAGDGLPHPPPPR